MDEELDEIRKRRLAELQEMMLKEQMEAAERERIKMELEAQKQAVLRMILTSEARDRLNTLRLTRPELVEQIESQLVTLANTGRLRGKITDSQLKAMLEKLVSRKRDIRIARK